MEELQNGTDNTSIRRGVQRILRFTNVVEEDDLVIEDCEIYKKDLAGYHIVLPRSKFKDMCFLMSKIYTEYEDICTTVFDKGTDDEIIDLCKIFSKGITYTEQFIRLSGGLENLLYTTNSFSEEDLIEEEDPEVIKELEEQIALLKKEMEEKESKHQEEITSLKNELNSVVSEREEFKKYFEGLSLEDGDIELILEQIELLGKEELKDVILSVLSNRAGEEDNEDLRVLTLYINDIAEALVNVLDQVENIGA